MQKFDLHMHTTYCDGIDPAEDMILAAIDRGLTAVGLSGHSFTPHDPSYCMSREGTLEYISEVRALRKKYEDRIQVLLGLEQDYYADTDLSPYDYRIGSVHYLFTEQGDARRARGDALHKYHDWADVDDSPYDLREFANTQGCSLQDVARLFYRTAGSVVRKTDCDIIGHFDLLTKFNERYKISSYGDVVDSWDDIVPADCEPFFDTEDPAYIEAWKTAIDSIFADCRDRYDNGHRNNLERLGLIEVGANPVFEINLGAIAKGYKANPYPAGDQLDYIRSRGGVLILSSDSHRAEHVAYRFEDFQSLI